MKFFILFFVAFVFSADISQAQNLPRYSLPEPMKTPYVSPRMAARKAFEEDPLIKHYQKLLADVQFHGDETHHIIDQAGQWAFVLNSGLPEDLDIFEWKKTHTVRDGMQLFRKYVTANKQMEYFDVFQQYAGWILITHFDMLSDTSAENAAFVSDLVDNLVMAKYRGYELLYNSLEYLRRYPAFKERSDTYQRAIEKYGLLDSSLTNSIRSYVEHPEAAVSNVEEQKYIRQYAIQKINDRDFFEKIRKLGLTDIK